MAPSLAAASIAATCLYGFIIVHTKKYTPGAPTMDFAVGTLILPAILVGHVGLMSVPPAMPTGNVLLSLSGLDILCSAVAYLLYYRLIRDVGPTRAISATFLIPMFGVTWGAIFFGETLNGGALIGGIIVLTGVALVLGVLPFRGKSPKTQNATWRGSAASFAWKSAPDGDLADCLLRLVACRAMLCLRKSLC